MSGLMSSIRDRKRKMGRVEKEMRRTRGKPQVQKPADGSDAIVRDFMRSIRKEKRGGLREAKPVASVTVVTKKQKPKKKKMTLEEIRARIKELGG